MSAFGKQHITLVHALHLVRAELFAIVVAGAVVISRCVTFGERL